METLHTPYFVDKYSTLKLPSEAMLTQNYISQSTLILLFLICLIWLHCSPPDWLKWCYVNVTHTPKLFLMKTTSAALMDMNVYVCYFHFLTQAWTDRGHWGRCVSLLVRDTFTEGGSSIWVQNASYQPVPSTARLSWEVSPALADCRAARGLGDHHHHYHNHQCLPLALRRSCGTRDPVLHR